MTQSQDQYKFLIENLETNDFFSRIGITIYFKAFEGKYIVISKLNNKNKIIKTGYLVYEINFNPISLSVEDFQKIVHTSKVKLLDLNPVLNEGNFSVTDPKNSKNIAEYIVNIVLATSEDMKPEALKSMIKSKMVSGFLLQTSKTNYTMATGNQTLQEEEVETEGEEEETEGEEEEGESEGEEEESEEEIPVIDMKRLNSNSKSKFNPNPYTLVEMKRFAKDFGMTGISQLKKDKLVTLLQERITKGEGKEEEEEEGEEQERGNVKINMKRLSVERKSEKNPNPYSVKELKEFAKKMKIPDSSTMKKAELVNAIRKKLSAPQSQKEEEEEEEQTIGNIKIDMKRLTNERTSKDNPNPYSVKQLKEFAKELEIPAYSTMKKEELVAILRNGGKSPSRVKNAMPKIDVTRLNSERKSKNNPNPYSLIELKDFAKQMGLHNYSALHKEDLVDEITNKIKKSGKSSASKSSRRSSTSSTRSQSSRE